MLKESQKMAVFDISRGLHTHNVNQDISQDYIILSIFEVSLIELSEFIFVHVPYIGTLVTWTYL